MLCESVGLQCGGLAECSAFACYAAYNDFMRDNLVLFDMNTSLAGCMDGAAGNAGVHKCAANITITSKCGQCLTTFCHRWQCAFPQALHGAACAEHVYFMRPHCMIQHTRPTVPGSQRQCWRHPALPGTWPSPGSCHWWTPARKHVLKHKSLYMSFW
jgi:hypothetical protein